MSDLLTAAKKIYEYKRLILSKGGASGHRYSESETKWVCDPWTQAFKDLGEEIDKLDRRAFK